MAKIFYYEVDDFLRKEDRYKLLENAKNVNGVEWNEIIPDKNHVWLTEGMEEDWEAMISIGNKEAKQLAGGQGVNASKVIFNMYSNGVQTNRDSWVYNFSIIELSKNCIKTIEFYNNQVRKFNNIKSKEILDSIIDYDDEFISWSSRLKECLLQNLYAQFSDNKIQVSHYRPFVKLHLYFDNILNHRRSLQPKIFPINKTQENLLISLSGIGNNKPFNCLITNIIADANFTNYSSQYPFFIYDEDGTNRKENISDWALKEYREKYKDDKITKWDIFYYIYGVLHKPEYRTKYAANLRRELPRIPFYDDFWKYATAGKKLADLHVNYESQPEYYLEKIEAPGKQLNYIVEKMKYNKDKSAIIYNDFLTLSGIPPETYEYKLGNRSALDWIIDQYQIKTDKRSGIVNDPNRLDEPTYIIDLIGKIITVSLETVKIVNGLRDKGEIKIVEGE